MGGGERMCGRVMCIVWILDWLPDNLCMQSSYHVRQGSESKLYIRKESKGAKWGFHECVGQERWSYQNKSRS